MNKYKVEFVRTEYFIVDVLAKNEKEAIDKATISFREICDHGFEHYHQTDEGETKVSTIYDVTNTDDPFNP